MTLRKPSLAAFIILAMGLGLLLGPLLGVRASPLGIVGKVYIDLIKMMAIPLVFFSIIDAVLSTTLSWKSAGRWGLIILVNTSCALIIGLTLSNLVQPGRGFPAPSTTGTGEAHGPMQTPSAATILDSVVPNSIVQPFAENNVLSVVLLALLLGTATRRYLAEKGAPHLPASNIAQAIVGVWSSALLLLVQVVPLAVFCVTAKTVGEHGYAPFTSLAVYVLVGFVGLLLQIIIVYPLWIRLVSRVPLGAFIEQAKKPVVYAFGTNSSLATLPLTLQALDGMGVSKAASRLGACIGTNFNNDGILLYEAMAVLFVAQAYGIELSVGQQVLAAGMSLIAAVGVAGVPEAGVVSLSLVLTAVGLPLEVVPLLLTVDWLVARMRSVTNVLSDMTVSTALDGLSRTNHTAHTA